MEEGETLSKPVDIISVGICTGNCCGGSVQNCLIIPVGS
jgi:hypothetical protein